ncbi:hypothetical protein KUTeg_004172 [Tegillarca granosa]|uniref:Cadherin domain-containing protein n=1 Tax=Tegillarca granosa TaxID=220873 RepID=A0ABQ9FQT3_TEGGR|nr:hypothetical protein KUTeg_004172 [Tegillarca granosa]
MKSVVAYIIIPVIDQFTRCGGCIAKHHVRILKNIFRIREEGYILSDQTMAWFCRGASWLSFILYLTIISKTEAQSQNLLQGDAQLAPYRAFVNLRGNLNDPGPDGFTLTLSRIASTRDVITFGTDPTFSIVPRPYTSTEFTSNTAAWLVLNKALDRDGATSGAGDDIPNVEIGISCQDNLNSPSIFYTLLITVIDVNDNAPVFSPPTYAASFHERDGSQYFSITDEASPRIVLDDPVDPAQRLSSTTVINITIIDNNDRPPAFIYPGCVLSDGICYNPTYYSSVTSTKVGGLMTLYSNVERTNQVSLIAENMDTLDIPLVFSILETIPRGYENRFSVIEQSKSGTQYTAVLRQDAAISRLNVQALDVIIRVVESSLQKYQNRATIRINVDSANDNDPQIIVPFVGYIYEDSLRWDPVLNQAGTTLMRLTVTDNDVSQGSYTFRVVGDPTFTVTNDGFVHLASPPLNFQTKSVYNLQVEVKEADTTQQRSSTAQVTINVIDTNNNAPTFPLPSYSYSIPEGDYTGSARNLGTIAASDGDTGLNALIRYSIVTVNPTAGIGKFRIDSSTALLSVNGSVAFPDTYTITIKAEDQPNQGVKLSNTVLAHVTVTSLGLGPPVIPADAYAVSISENVPISSSIFTVPATDPEGAALTFLITGGNTNADLAITNNGTLYNVNNLDRERTSSYNITVTVTDTTQRTDSAIVYVFITDMNDNKPVFGQSSYVFSVQENLNAATVGTVSASDRDFGANAQLFYQLESSNLPFTIDQISGQLTTSRALDYETVNRYEFRVLAIDRSAHPRTGTALVTVNVLDSQDNVPLFPQNLYQESVREDISIGSPVLTVTALDADTIKSISYKFLGGEFASFNIDANTGRITTNTALDFETKSSYSFTVTTTDGENSGQISATTNVQITVLDVNDFPPVIGASQGQITIPENQPIGSVLQTYTATDNDPQNTLNSLISWRIISVTPSSGSNYFYMDGTSGELVVRNDLRNDPNTNYTYGFGRLSYTLIPSTLLPNHFGIDQNSAAVSLVSSVSADPNTRYIVRIVATDGGGLSATATATISVLRNRFDPLWTRSAPYSDTIDILETRPVLDTVYSQLNAIDTDLQAPYNTVVRTITGTTQAQQYFDIDGASVKLIRSLITDRTINQFVLTVRLQDGGNPPRVQQQTFVLTINIIRNVQPPVFFNTSYDVTINENLGIGSQVVTVSAQDLDPNNQFNTLTYSFTGDNNAATFFTIISSTGEIRVNGDLSSTPTSRYTLLVTASDGGNPPRTGYAFVYIRVVRNFNDPVWTTTNFVDNILEIQTLHVPLNINLPGGVTDNDRTAPNNVVSFRMDSSSPAKSQNYFEILTNGDVTVRRSLQADTDTTYTFYARAYDNGDPSRESSNLATITISVSRNRAPAFSLQSYQASVAEDVNTGFSVTSVRATDPDTGIPQFNQITYSMVEVFDAANAYFSVDGNSGQITVINDLSNAPRTNVFRFTVRATDGYLSDTASVAITVNRNLKAPVFTTRDYTATINENHQVGTNINVQVSATDADKSAPNNETSYIATGDNRALQYFNIDAKTGVVTVAYPLFYDTVTTNYIMTVVARDNAVTGSLQSQLSATVTVIVIRNLHSPLLLDLPATVNIPRTSLSGTFVRDVNATDDDNTFPFNNVRYEIVSGTGKDIFNINSATGVVTLGTNLATLPNRLAEYKLTIRAYDGDVPEPRSSFGELTITVDSNLQTPVITTPGAGANYQARLRIPETTDFNTVRPYNEINYVLVGQGATSDYFYINANGEIKLKLSLLGTDLPQFVGIIRVEDKGSPPNVAVNSATVTIDIDRNQQAPQWQGLPYQKVISQTETVGSVVFSVLATDTDAFNIVSYEIVDSGSTSIYFNINSPNPGDVSVRSNLGAVNDLTFLLYVRAYDNGVPPKSNTTFIEFTVRRNLQRPVISPTVVQARISEEQSLGVAITKVNATDADPQPPHSTIRYEMFGNALAKEYFFVDAVTGEVYVKKSLTLDATNQNSYQFFVQAYDLGSPSLRSAENASVSISVYRNGFDPFFLGSPSASIPETTAVQTSIALIGFTDSDTDIPFNQVTLSVIGDVPGTNYFSVDTTGSAVGTVRVSSDLKQDTQLNYLLRVEAKDGGNPPRSAVTTVPITVNRNLNRPIFSPINYNTTLSELQSSGFTILTVTATDSDTHLLVVSNDHFLCVISNTFFVCLFIYISYNYDCFFYHATTPNVTLQYQSIYVQFKFDVEAVDLGIPNTLSAINPAAVTIFVNRNLNPPQITNTNFNIPVNETLATQSVVFNVNAIDLDLVSPFNTLTYQIIGDDNSASIFSISSDGIGSGLRVRVLDGGIPRLSDEKVFTITIKRNFFPPAFVQQSYSQSVKESEAPDTVVLTVSARDNDRNRVILNFIIIFLVFNMYFLNTLLLKLIFKKNSEYEIYVQDMGTPTLRSANIPLTITVLRNQFPPELINLPASTTLSASAIRGSTVFTVQSRDNDTVIISTKLKFLGLVYVVILNKLIYLECLECMCCNKL